MKLTETLSSSFSQLEAIKLQKTSDITCNTMLLLYTDWNTQRIFLS